MRVIALIVTVILLIVAVLAVVALVARLIRVSAISRAKRRAKWEIYSTPTGNNMISVGVRKVARIPGKDIEVSREEVSRVDVRDSLESSVELQVARSEASNRASNYNAMEVE